MSLRLAEAIRHANARVRAGAAAAKRALRGMGTTIVAAVRRGGAAAIAHAETRAPICFAAARPPPHPRPLAREAMAALPAARDLTPDDMLEADLPET